ncbi:MAG TPA: hypothetical protein DDW30_02185 [Clostridiales bacterium]|nr:hypothetical protein [Clostridiales bacterium]
MNDNVVFDSAKRAGTFVGKTLACFAAGIMLVADTATRKRNFVTGNVNVVRQEPKSVPAYASDKKTRFVCRECGAPVDVKSFRLAHGYTPGKGFLCDNCRAMGKSSSKYYGGADYNDSETLSATCADCGKVLRAKSYRELKKYRIGKKYYCRDCYMKNY